MRLLPWGPACRLRFHHAAVDLGHASGIPASREGTKVVRNLRHPRGPTSLPFLCQCGTSQRTCGAVIPPVCSERRVDEGRGRGSHDAVLLDLAGSRRLPVDCRTVEAALSDSNCAVEKHALFIVAPSTSHAQLIVAPLRPHSPFQVVVEVACSIYCRAVKVARSVDCRAVKAALSDSSRAVEKRALFILALPTSRAQLIVAPLRPRSLFQVVVEVACSVYCRAVEVARSIDCCAVEVALIFLFAFTHSSSSSRRIVHCCTVAHIFIVVPTRAHLHHCAFIRTEMCSCFQGLYLETENCFPTLRDIILSQSHVH